jgi:glycosyltransferase involved in cell wall biosynthesis
MKWERAMRTASPFRRHVCVVTETYPPEINGVALTLARLVDGLRAREHAISIVRPRQRPDRVDEASDPDLTLVRGLPLPGYSGLRMGLPAGAMLTARWASRPPDVVYVATEGPLGWSAVRTACRLGVPVLSGFHTNFHGYAKHYHARWLEGLVARYLRGFHNRTRGTLVPTADLLDELVALGFENLRVLGRGVDGRLFHPGRRSTALRSAWGVSETAPVALYVGRVAAEKNVGLAIEAYRAMRRACSSLRGVVVGEGPLRAALQQAHPELLFCGALTGEELAVHYASADVFLFPSETETFGNVTLEALASGLAVVAYDYAAARLHVAHGRAGLLVPYGDRRTFVETAAALVRAPEPLAWMRRQARDSVSHLDWDQVVERFETFLEEVAWSSTEGDSILTERRHRR